MLLTPLFAAAGGLALVEGKILAAKLAYVLGPRPEDAIVLYTDGISEGMNHANEIYGTERLASYVATGPHDMKSLVTGILEDVEKFCDGRPQRDDMCLVAFQRTK